MAEKNVNPTYEISKTDTRSMLIYSKLRKVIAEMLGHTSQKGLLALGDQTIVSATSFFTSIIIARNCTKDELGLYALGMTIVFFLVSIQESIVTTPYTVYSPRLDAHARSYYNGSTLLHQLALSLLFIGIVVISAIIAESLGVSPTDLTRVLWGLTVVIIPVLFREYVRRVKFAQLHMKAVFIFDIAVSVIQVSALLLLANAIILSANRAYLAIGAACAIVSVIWLIPFLKECTFQIKQTISDFQTNWSFGKWVIAANVTSLASTQLYLWFINIFHGTADTGILAACQGVIFLSNPFLIGFKNVLGPKISHVYATGGKINLRQAVIKVSVTIGAVMSIFCLFLVLFGEICVVMLYGRQYAGYGNIISVLALSTFIYSITLPIAFGLWALERSDLNFRIDILSLGITMTLGLYFVKLFGSLGVAYSLLISNIITSFIRYIIFNKFSKYT